MAVNPLRPGALSWTPEGSNTTVVYDQNPSTPPLYVPNTAIKAATTPVVSQDMPVTARSVLNDILIVGSNVLGTGTKPPTDAAPTGEKIVALGLTAGGLMIVGVTGVVVIIVIVVLVRYARKASRVKKKVASK